MFAIRERVDIIQLSEELNEVLTRIRRDFDVLEKQNKLIRTHGGME
ncbi:hypothetical protein CSV71_08690 [Sporosarcina sp. P21c]|nr:hypothetical protein CSV78_07655 [Sporosarcina sp. P16a]PIC89715.1 hypothetical protein CSV71_08690 [Sporosarcina sp. P21c]PIC92911.1 hypothetical protein CSV70_08405 [Sporosarcina sp. P25]